MRKLIILFSFFIISCDGGFLFNSPSNPSKPSDGGNYDKTMYIKVKFQGTAINPKYSYEHSYNKKYIYVKDVMFQLSNSRDTYTFYGKNGMPGFVEDNKTGFSYDDGHKFSIPFYLGDEILKVKYNTSMNTASIKTTIVMGIASKNGASMEVSWRMNYIEFSVPLKSFNENIYTNNALFTMNVFEEGPNEYNFYDLKYNITFDGFEKK